MTDNTQTTRAQWLLTASQLLEHSHSSHPRIDAELLLCHALCMTRTQLFTWPEHTITSPQLTQLNALLKRAQRGEPLAYITGEKEFWSLSFKVTPDVLIPRPETELLVELALAQLDNNTASVLDAGTGSGAVAISIAHELAEQGKKNIAVTASDLSLEALMVAKNNAATAGTNHIHFVQSHWLSAFQDNRFSLIVSNPPYIEKNDPHLASAALLHEPLSALASGDEGLDAIRELILDTRRVGCSNVMLMMEHGYNQGPAVRELLASSDYHDIDTHKDLAGLERVTLGRYNQ